MNGRYVVSLWWRDSLFPIDFATSVAWKSVIKHVLSQYVLHTLCKLRLTNVWQFFLHQNKSKSSTGSFEIHRWFRNFEYASIGWICLEQDPKSPERRHRSYKNKVQERTKIFNEMKRLQLGKLNRATYNLLLDVSPMVDQETNVLQHFLSSELVSLGSSSTSRLIHRWLE